MNNHFDDKKKSIRDTIIGLGEKSVKKSYYPELRKKITNLEDFKNKYEKLIRVTSTGYLLLNKEGVIGECNEAFLNIIEEDDLESVVGKKLELFFNEENKHVITYALNEIINSGFIKSLEINIQSKKEKIVPVEISAVLIDRTNDSEIICIMRDITERKESEKKIRNSEYNYRQLFEGAFDALCIIKNENVIYRNNKFKNLFEESEELEIKEFYKIINDDYVDKYFSYIYEYKRNKLIKKTFICDAKTLNNKRLNLEISISEIKWYDENVLYLNIRDISEKLKLENSVVQAQKMESIGNLAGGIAHDFNNILTTIIGNSELLKMKKKYDDSHIEEIISSAQRASGLTNQLLAFSRKQNLQTKKIDINSNITHLIKMLNRLIGEDIKLNVKLDPDLPCVMADSGQIDQTIMNLVVNSRDAISEFGEISIKTSTEYFDKTIEETYNLSKPGDFVCLTIEDNGSGMDRKTIDKIFEPFFTTKEMGQGTGLGLSVVYGVVKQHDGWINVYSEPGRGSTFKVYIPSVGSCLDKEENESEQFIYEHLGNNQKILIVEDEESLRRVIKSFLKNQNLNIDIVENAEKAINLFKENEGDYDLVFTDVVLPDKNGYDLIQELNSIKPGFQILFTSGYTDDKSKWEMIDKMGYQFIQKPYSLKKLLETLLSFFKL